MTRQSKSSKQRDGEKPPSGIPKEDWDITPTSIRKIVMAKKYQKKPQNYLPVWIILFLNIIIIAGSTFFLNNVLALPCVAPSYISSLTATLVLLATFHLLWRYIYPAIRKGSLKDHTITYTLGTLRLETDSNIIYAVLNEIHPWKIPARVLGLILLIFFTAGVFFNISPYSPFYLGDAPFAIQGFVVQRLNPPVRELLAPGETLTMKVGETVILDVAYLGDVQVTCTWDANTQNDKTHCSINYTALTLGQEDILTVSVKPTCDFRYATASLFTIVKP